MVVDFFQAKGNLPIENLIKPSPILSEERSNNSSQKNVLSMMQNNTSTKRTNIKVIFGENQRTLENKIKSLEPLKTLLHMMLMATDKGKPRTFIKTECEKIITALANANLDSETLKSLFEQSKSEQDSEEWFKETICGQLKDFWSLYAPLGSNMEKIVFFLATSPQCKQWLESGQVNLLMESGALRVQQQFSHSATPLWKKQQQVKVTSGIVNVEAQVGLNFGVKMILFLLIMVGEIFIQICRIYKRFIFKFLRQTI